MVQLAMQIRQTAGIEGKGTLAPGYLLISASCLVEDPNPRTVLVGVENIVVCIA